MPSQPAIHSRTPTPYPVATGAALLMLMLPLPTLGNEGQQIYVRVIECDGEQYVQIITDASQEFVLQDPCALVEKTPRPNSSDWICVGGRCFPRTFIVAPRAKQPHSKRKTPSAPHAPVQAPQIKGFR